MCFFPEIAPFNKGKTWENANFQTPPFLRILRKLTQSSDQLTPADELLGITHGG